MSNICVKPFSLKVSGPPPAAWWKMEEAAGDRIDAVNSIHLPLFSGATPAGRVAGKVNFGMNFNQGNDDVLYETANDSHFGYQAHGFDQYCWVNLSAFVGIGTSLDFCDYLIKNGGGGLIREFFLNWTPNNAQILLIVSGLGTVKGVAFTPGLNTWHLIRYYYDLTSGKVGLQIDNGAKNESANLGLALAASPLGAMAIEANSAGVGNSINVSLDEHSVWLAQAPSDTVAGQIWNGGAGHTWPL